MIRKLDPPKSSSIHGCTGAPRELLAFPLLPVHETGGGRRRTTTRRSSSRDEGGQLVRAQHARWPRARGEQREAGGASGGATEGSAGGAAAACAGRRGRGGGRAAVVLEIDLPLRIGWAVEVVPKNCLFSSLFTLGKFHLSLENASWLLETV